ncbi:MAG: hypothetical protein D6696_06295 [Acidobacteria bacterium]|nr:MAG: hypothetical protein D6696_06295 [Acidobacteriota bacterium]
MIAFVTLFLGLVAGPQTVEVAAGETVAAVELRLDGAPVARLEAPPWRAEIDLGRELMPHRLLAVAFDAAGEEVARAEQWLNLPQPPAGASVLIEEPAGGGPTVARLAWQSLAGASPQQILVTFDGQPLTVTDPARIELPPHDRRALHFLRAEVIFSANVSSVVEVTFGGVYADRVSSELTAIPLRPRGGKRRLRDPAQLRGVLVENGRPLEVVAVDHGPAIAVIVPDRRALPLIDELGRSLLRDRRVTRMVGLWERFRTWASLKGRQSVRLLWPVSRRQRTVGGLYDLFPASETFPAGSHGLLYLLQGISRPPQLDDGRQRLSDAVANAGLEAASRRRARAVVLLTSGEPEDASVFDPGRVRRFLERLRVPLHVWALEEPQASAAWGEVHDVSNPTRLARAANLLARDLDGQWIVWLDGIHLPQDVGLAPGVEDLAPVP